MNVTISRGLNLVINNFRRAVTHTNDLGIGVEGRVAFLIFPPPEHFNTGISTSRKSEFMELT